MSTLCGRDGWCIFRCMARGFRRMAALRAFLGSWNSQKVGLESISRGIVWVVSVRMAILCVCVCARAYTRRPCCARLFRNHVCVQFIALIWTQVMYSEFQFATKSPNLRLISTSCSQPYCICPEGHPSHKVRHSKRPPLSVWGNHPIHPSHLLCFERSRPWGLKGWLGWIPPSGRRAIVGHLSQYTRSSPIPITPPPLRGGSHPNHPSCSQGLYPSEA
mmetsp:Transcript_64708/g.108509  ORF Transcript_64708/g.108509 Transcript_64708/m.108509 type:complete len:218 (+) Transcript_64708:213-866(+)